MATAAGSGQGGEPRSGAALWLAAATAALLALGFRRRSDGFDAAAKAERRDAAARGRYAATPSDIPARGWKDIFWRLYERLTEDRILAIAAGVTFYILLAIFPGIAALVAIYGLFADPTTIAQHLDDVASFMPGGAIDILRDELNRITAQPRAALGLAFIVGLSISLWSANAGVKAMIDALNIAYAEREKRSFIRLTAVSFVFTVAGIVGAMVGLGALVVLPLVLEFLGLQSVTERIVAVAKWPVLFVVAACAIAVLYRYGPSRTQAKWRWLSWGSAFAAAGWIGLSLLFSWYAANFGSYNKTYGSLGAVIGFMTWIWISTIVIMLGAELDAEIEHQTCRDSTVGPPKPMGTRGATMADTVGRPAD
jgi:membrane protein